MKTADAPTLSSRSTSAVTPAIDVADLTVAYRDKPVLWDIDLRVPQETLMAIVGPNGAGQDDPHQGHAGPHPQGGRPGIDRG